MNRVSDERLAELRADWADWPSAAAVLDDLRDARTRILQLESAVAEHHAQKADDRCWMDDDKLYAAAGLPPGDGRVGDKEAMLANCRRFIERRCEGGHWPTYKELEEEVERLRQLHKENPGA